jgi:hypothetical protein
LVRSSAGLELGADPRRGHGRRRRHVRGAGQRALRPHRAGVDRRCDIPLLGISAAAKGGKRRTRPDPLPHRRALWGGRSHRWVEGVGQIRRLRPLRPHASDQRDNRRCMDSEGRREVNPSGGCRSRS